MESRDKRHDKYCFRAKIFATSHIILFVVAGCTVASSWALSGSANETSVEEKKFTAEGNILLWAAFSKCAFWSIPSILVLFGTLQSNYGVLVISLILGILGIIGENVILFKNELLIQSYSLLLMYCVGNFFIVILYSYIFVNALLYIWYLKCIYGAIREVQDKIQNSTGNFFSISDNVEMGQFIPLQPMTAKEKLDLSPPKIEYLNMF